MQKVKRPAKVMTQGGKTLREKHGAWIKVLGGATSRKARAGEIRTAW